MAHRFFSLIRPSLVTALVAAAVLGGAGDASAAAGGNTLYANEALYANQSLFSDFGRYQLIMQLDGNLVLYGEDHRVLWNSPTYGCQNAYAIMQWDGNFVIYSSNCAPWATSTFGSGGCCRLLLKSDGDLLVATSNDTVLWRRGGQPVVASSDSKNPANFNKTNTCTRLVNGSAPTRYADGTNVGSTYQLRNTQQWQSPCTSQLNPVWVDAQEKLQMASGNQLYFVHGGPRNALGHVVPYGHVSAGDLVTQFTPTNSGGSVGAGGSCTPLAGDRVFQIKIDPAGTADSIPTDWQYKIGQTSADYHKYQSIGEDQGDLGLPGSLSARYGYLSWTWVMRTTRGDTPSSNQNPWTGPDAHGNERATNSGGGVVRALLKQGQEFQRCSGIESINSLAWGQNATSSTDPIGRVRVIYGKTRLSSNGPWLYGWAIHSHQTKVPDGNPNDGSYANTWNGPISHMNCIANC
jgi:hypothetical protein